MNIVALSGRLGADIIEHITQSGTYVIHFPLAVRKSFKRDEKGNYPVNYFQIEVWGALAKTCKEHLSKGQLVSVSGRLDAKSYDDKKWTEEIHDDGRCERSGFSDAKTGNDG